MKKKEIIYCIPGLGLNHKVFQKLNIPSATLKFLDFITPLEGETIAQYAQRMAENMIEDEFSLLGMSMGGMLSVEIARIKKVKQLFLISTVKNASEMPSILKYIDLLPTSSKSATKLAIDATVALQPFYDKTDEAGHALFEEMIGEADRDFLAWALKEISHWKHNEPITCPFYHLHGTSDLVFPIKNIDQAETVKEGTHFMIYNNADVLSERIEKRLSAKPL